MHDVHKKAPYFRSIEKGPTISRLGAVSIIPFVCCGIHFFFVSLADSRDPPESSQFILCLIWMRQLCKSHIVTLHIVPYLSFAFPPSCLTSHSFLLPVAWSRSASMKVYWHFFGDKIPVIFSFYHPFVVFCFRVNKLKRSEISAWNNSWPWEHSPKIPFILIMNIKMEFIANGYVW